MNCDKLHEMLNAKDSEVKTRNEKTEYWFNEIKDDVLELMVSKAIDGEFKRGVVLRQSKVVEFAFRKLGHDDIWLAKYFPFSYDSCWENSCFTINHKYSDNSYDNSVGILLLKFEENIDYELLKSKLMNYLLSKGFRYEWKTNIDGDRVKTGFLIISRHDLEQSCCANKVFDIKHQASDLNDGGCDQGSVLLFSIVVFCFVSAFIAIIYA